MGFTNHMLSDTHAAVQISEYSIPDKEQHPTVLAKEMQGRRF
jgi:hypothetical protein